MSPYRLPDAILERLLADDVPYGDATTFALGIGDRTGRLELRARGAMVLCGSEEAARLGELRGLRVIGDVRSSGTALLAGEMILTLAGRADALHGVWKTAQTLMEYLSGIASSTAAIVAAARAGNPEVSVVCTRKSFPGTKEASLKAILCGGATPHRTSLSETLLLFAEHRAFLAGEKPSDTVARLRRQWPERALVVEVSSEEEAATWLAAGVDVLQLEKMPLAAIARVATLAAALPKPALVAAAGGINAANAEAHARTGARVLVTSAPYAAPPRDVAVTLVADHA